MFAWHIIKTKKDHSAALSEIERLMDLPAPTRDETRQLELGAHLVAEYEETAFPVPLPTPVQAIRFRMEQQGLSRKDLEPMLGGPSKVSEVLNGKRHLSMAMIRALHRLRSSPSGNPASPFSFPPHRSRPLTDHANL